MLMFVIMRFRLLINQLEDDLFLFFDQNQFTSSDPNFTHAYFNDGTDYPLQVVYNEYGCRSIGRRYLWNPCGYAPNTFIPNGDGVNAFLM